jgi:hypothetical protein
MAGQDARTGGMMRLEIPGRSRNIFCRGAPRWAPQADGHQGPPKFVVFPWETDIYGLLAKSFFLLFPLPPAGGEG